MLKILLVEDDVELRHYLFRQLSHAGNTVVACETIVEADREMGGISYDIYIVDRMLPDGDGMNLIASARESGNQTPALILSALGEVNHRVEGLRKGCDDYLTKPFDIVELMARIEVMYERSIRTHSALAINVGDLSIDVLKQRVSRAGREIRLQPREFRLLEYLSRYRDHVVTRSMLLEDVWGLNFDPQTNVVDVHISRLRTKIDKGFEQRLLHTIRGEGYRLGLNA